ncbi:MAG: IS110 family transposase [Thermoplasmata archaeon]|nr:IS110 family transposase [Thermoplasmata archaeon]MBE3141344.1 IS110 family transposase [Thermoplasmata archaeon]
MKNTKYYIGLDVHKERTSYCIRDKLGNILIEAEAATLYSELEHRLKPYLAASMIGLEASTSYYTLYQNFLRNNYHIKVANTIQLRQLIAKNDKLDAQRLSEMLRLGTFPCSYIPEEKIQHLRSLIQMRHALMQKKVRCNNRIQAFLDRNGVMMPLCKAFSKKWKHALMQHLGSGNISTELRYEYNHYVYLEKTNEQADQEIIGYTKTYWNQEYQLLRSITGFGVLLPCYIIAFVHPIERFLSNRKLRRYAGVIPVAKESGNTTSRGRIPKTSSKALLRWALVQAANTIGKTNTTLGRYYRRKKSQKKNTGIAKIAVASTLVDIIYKVLTTKKPYISTAC